jgi:hypothetical protein
MRDSVAEVVIDFVKYLRISNLRQLPGRRIEVELISNDK